MRDSSMKRTATLKREHSGNLGRVWETDLSAMCYQEVVSGAGGLPKRSIWYYEIIYGTTTSFSIRGVQAKRCL
jgi:hypothetical protein